MSRVRVVLADDHQSVVAMVRETLGEEFEVIGTAENGDQAVDWVLMLDPDVLVTDISMPVLNGLEAAQRLQKANCRARIVFLTIHEDPEFVAAAFAAGRLPMSSSPGSARIWHQPSTGRCWETHLCLHL